MQFKRQIATNLGLPQQPKANSGESVQVVDLASSVE